MQSRTYKSISICLLMILTVATVSSQNPVATQFDAFGRGNSEEIEARLDGVLNQLSDSRIRVQFLISRGTGDPYGLTYRRFGIYKTYLTYRKIDRSRFFVTYCKPEGTEQMTQVWEVPFGSSPRACNEDSLTLSDTTLFDRAVSPTERYTDPGCCAVDAFGPAAAVESIEEFGKLLTQHPDWKGRIFVYAGTNVYLTTDNRGRDLHIRHLDRRSDVQALLERARSVLRQQGVPSKQVRITIGGYRDDVAAYELWLVPSKGKAPMPKPTYFLGTTEKRRTLQRKRH